MKVYNDHIVALETLKYTIKYREHEDTVKQIDYCYVTLFLQLLYNSQCGIMY